jgi:hypothetical protein
LGQDVGQHGRTWEKDRRMVQPGARFAVPVGMLPLVALVHALAAAALFGSMFYSLVVLHPRARGHFARVRELEQLITALARGARAKVLSALGLLAASGVLLAVFPAQSTARTRLWLVLVLAKAALLLGATLLFAVVSWRWWPARLFCLDDELPAQHRRFRRAGATLTLFAALALALGVLAHRL